MGLLNKLKKFISIEAPLEKEFEKVLVDSRLEYKNTHTYVYWDAKANETSVCKDIVLLWPDKKRIDFMLYCIKLLDNHSKIKTKFHHYSSEKNYSQIGLVESYLNYLLKVKLTMDEEDIERIMDAFINNKIHAHSNLFSWPIALFINQIDKQYRGSILSERMKQNLVLIVDQLKKENNTYYEKEKLKLVEKLEVILHGSDNPMGSIKPVSFLGDDEFTDYANHSIQSLSETEKSVWYQLIAKAQKASGSRPSQKFLNETKVLIKELSSDKFKKIVNDWFRFLIKLKEKSTVSTFQSGGHTWTYTSTEFLSPINVEAIKGLVWICSHFHDAVTIHSITDLAERCYKKIPQKGPASAAIGNACLYTLYKSKGLDGIGQLSRLKLRIKQTNTQTLIENYLNEAAKEQGVSLHEIEDLAVQDFGLVYGSRDFQVDEFTARLVITGVGKSEITWIKVDGSAQKSVPVQVKESHASKYKKIKDIQKQIDQTTSAQRDRIDRMLRNDRNWSLENFNTYYLSHGLMSYLTNKIIWTIQWNGKPISTMRSDGKWITVDGEKIEPDKNSTIKLWHPATQTVSEIKQWRNFLIESKIQQPLKQAFREVYLLTEAEIKTKTYSNRMAAHILKQHQFVTLAKGRSWSSRLLGNWDGGDQDIAELKIPEFKLKAQFWVQSVDSEDAYNDSGIWNYVSTDQVRFVQSETDEIIDLVDVPVIPFSEVLRDVDLFVGVCSVGNDPTWRDTGGIAQYRDYWTSYSFGDLNEVSKNRKEILSGLLPKLKISKVSEIRDKFLVVKGKLRTYKIHIGSTNILMEPNDQYLCIVPDRSAKSHTENLFIPFEGDNGLSIVLSKAFLLADDDKITDSTITSQIRQK